MQSWPIADVTTRTTVLHYWYTVNMNFILALMMILHTDTDATTYGTQGTEWAVSVKLHSRCFFLLSFLSFFCTDKVMFVKFH